jgi:hypothetical protein
MPETMRAIRLTGPVDIDGLTGARSRTPAAGRCRRSPTSPGTDSARPAANRRCTHARRGRAPRVGRGSPMGSAGLEPATSCL